MSYCKPNKKKVDFFFFCYLIKNIECKLNIKLIFQYPQRGGFGDSGYQNARGRPRVSFNSIR